MAYAKVFLLQNTAQILSIELRHVTPDIYRIIVIPSRMTLPTMHVAILRAMGW
ncbi:hypothetical protein [Bordetella sp. FB-8]|uniref:IS1096 element passenger TnpR family protein n=1 Tax=Bordetella sp. FB-8 TaxID=1159870 RepID=UPI00036AFE1F|nr:hypothetical protein [Bordetella sp. FB-8]